MVLRRQFVEVVASEVNGGSQQHGRIGLHVLKFEAQVIDIGSEGVAAESVEIRVHVDQVGERNLMVAFAQNNDIVDGQPEESLALMLVDIINDFCSV